MEMITPFPVPTQRRFPPISSAVIRTKEKPSLPVPVDDQMASQAEDLSWFLTGFCLRSYPASYWRTARCPRPGGAGACERGTAAGSSPTGWTPTRRRRSTPADAPGSPCEGGHRRTSTGRRRQQPVTTVASHESWGGGPLTHLNLHALWLDDVDLVLVAAPDFIVDHGHAADGVVRTA